MCGMARGGSQRKVIKRQPLTGALVKIDGQRSLLWNKDIDSSGRLLQNLLLQPSEPQKRTVFYSCF